MTLSFSRVRAILLAAGLVASPALRAEPGHVFPTLTPVEINAIAAAAPAHPRVAPAKPRAILVFYRTEGYVHPSIPYFNEAIRQVAAKTGAFRADFSDDMSVFTPGNLARYDAVIFQNTTALAFNDIAQRQALLDFVRSGKVFVGVHAALDNFYSWPEAQAMIGGVFHSHPWKSIDTVAVKIDDPDHPVVAAFAGKGFWLREEIYEVVGPYSRDRQRVLLSLDMSKAENWRPAEKLMRTDADFPVAWVKSYGQGRVFYISIGHNPNLFCVPELLQCYLDGIQFATGDLPADDTLPVKPIAAALASVPGLPLQDRSYPNSLAPDYLDRLAGYNFGPDRVPVVAIDLYLRGQGPRVYPAVEQSLLGLLARPGLPAGAKDYIIRTLSAIGSKASIPALQGLVGDPVFGSTAVYAIFKIPGPESDAALLAELGSAQPPVLYTVINAVGRRGLAAGIARLVELSASADGTTATAALVALGDIGTRESLQALRQAHISANAGLDRAWAELGAAGRIVAASPDDDRAVVDDVYNELFRSPDPDPIRVAALRGLAKVEGPAALPLICDALHDPRSRVRTSAANLFAATADRAAIASFSLRFSTLDPSVQVVILNAIDARGTPDALPLFQIGLISEDAAVRIAAIQGLGDVGDPTAIAPLITRLEGDSAESRAAADSLGRLRNRHVVDALIGALASSTPRVKASILQILGGRADHRVFPVAVAAVDDTQPAVRAAAFGAIASTARQDDLPTVLGLFSKTRTASERRSMERALLEVVRVAPDPDAVADAIDRTLGTIRGPARYSLLTALVLTGTDHARAILAGLMRSPTTEERREVIRAISGARNPRLDRLLIADARNTPDPVERILALRAYLDLLQVPNGRSIDEITAGYGTAWSLASRAEEQDAILAALRHMNTNAADAQAAKLQATRARPTSTL